MRLALTIVLTFAASAALAQSAPPTRYELEGGMLKLPGPILFEPSSDKLKAESDEALAHVKGFLVEKDYVTLLRIEGHTDTDGNADANLALTEKRALAVGRWLVAKGIDCRRLLAVGFGGDKPVAPNDTPANKAKNRRMAFAMATLRGKAVGGMPVDGGGRVAGDICR